MPRPLAPQARSSGGAGGGPASGVMPAPGSGGPADASSSRDPADQILSLRRLAVSVIHRALKDLAASGCDEADRASAREFLAGSEMLLHWCRVAALDPRRVMAWAGARGRPAPRG